VLSSYAELWREIMGLIDESTADLNHILTQDFSDLLKNPKPRVRILIFKGCKGKGTIFISILPRGSPRKEVMS
jgi:hypothetical protein